MIQANELTVGNWLFSKTLNENVKIDEILINGVFVEDDICISIYENLEPILLTEEILLKCGAVLLVGLEDSYKRFNLDGIQLSTQKDREYFTEYVHQIPIKYLHTLQNFVFATKQKELEINLY